MLQRIAILRIWLLLALAGLAVPAVQAQDCAVISSGQLASSDYVLHYEGGCQDGLAQGQGTARWSLRHAPDATPVVWQGRFDHGILLTPQTVQGAQAIDRSRVLLNLGSLPGAPTDRAGNALWVESRPDGKQPASGCLPSGLHVLTDEGSELASDDAAQSWLEAAYEYWTRHCPDATDLRPGYRLKVQLHALPNLSPDGYGNLPQAAVRAVRVLGAPPETAWQQYSNRPAQAQATARQEAEQETRQQDSQARLLAFAREVSATHYVTPGGLDQNPFRYGQEVLLLAVQLVEVRTPTQAYVRALASERDARWSLVRVEGQVSDWDERSRLIAVRVKGRTDTETLKGLLELELVGSRACTEWDCEDYLLGPGRQWLREGRLDS